MGRLLGLVFGSVAGYVLVSWGTLVVSCICRIYYCHDYPLRTYILLRNKTEK